MASSVCHESSPSSGIIDGQRQRRPSNNNMTSNGNASVGSSSSSGSLDDQKAALLSLVQDSEGRAWSTSLHGWSADSDVAVCEWEGVTCRAVSADGEGGDGQSAGRTRTAVVELSLPSDGLSGTIPTELGSLSDLEVLTLKNNMLRGSIPQEVANLKKLVSLDLTQCFLTGTLPQHFESPHLRSLNLAGNAISGRFFEEEHSPHLDGLNVIRMENNLLTGTLSGLALTKMPNLETLSLSDNDLSGLIPGAGLGSLSALHHLYLDSNHFVGPLPSQLAQKGKSQILELWVQDNALSGTVPNSYARFDHLHDFYIDGNKLTGALPPDLCGPQINEDFFENVPPEVERNYCNSIACPPGSVAFEGMYPCTECPGGEAARLKNRYLGQQGKCVDYTQRDVLKIFHEATTKAGSWSGLSDWDEDGKPVCDMTGITCDAHGNVVEIMLKNRNLQGHIPEKIGLLPFLETLDVSDNKLMGYMPSDLKWTSITNLDISGNKIRGMIPPLLCKMEQLNGNGNDNVFHCDRIACPAGTYNSNGFHHGLDGETCEPCYDETPFIAQRTCKHTQHAGIQLTPSQPPKSDWKETLQMAKEASKQMNIYTKVGIGIFLGSILIAIVICSLVKRARSRPQKKHDQEMNAVLTHSFKEDDEDDVMEDSLRSDDDHHVGHARYRDSPQRRAPDSLAQHMTATHRCIEEDDDYSFAPDGNARHRAQAYRDFVVTEDDDYDEDTNSIPWTQRSASDFIKEHQGLTLNRRDKFKKVVSGKMSEDLNRRARETASNINVGARRRWHGAKMKRLSSF